MPPYLYYPLVGIVFLLMISILVAAHELGHYLFARMFNMGVEEFAIGFGKRPLFTWMRRTYKVDAPDASVETPDGESAATPDDEHPRPRPGNTETTDFTVRAWPLGGFVRIKGMLPEDDGSEVKIPGGFYSKRPWQRFLVLLAGPLFSVLAGVFLLIPIFMMAGIMRPSNEPIVSGVSKGSPAEVAGLRKGDRIVSIGDKRVQTFFDFHSVVRDSAGRKLSLELERGGAPVRVEIVPLQREESTPVLGPNLELTPDERPQGFVGVAMPLPRKEVLTFTEATREAFATPVSIVKNLAGVFVKPANFEKNIGGPASMVAMTGIVLGQGLDRLLWLAAMLSISVGIFNLLPVPPLDGGQMLVALAEMLRGGRRLSMQVQNALSGVGLVLVMCLMLGAIFVDIKRFIPRGEEDKPAVIAPKK